VTEDGFAVPVVAEASSPPARTLIRGRSGMQSRRQRSGASYALLAADASALLLASLFTGLTFDAAALRAAPLFLIVALTCAGASGLNGAKAARVDQSTVDEIGSVFLIVTTASWLFLLLVNYLPLAPVDTTAIVVLWLVGIVFVLTGRGSVRSLSRRMTWFSQKTIVVGAGEVGQLIARKLRHHPEYGLSLVGIVDQWPRDQRADLDQLTLLGPLGDLPDLIERFGVRRVIIAFSNEREDETVNIVRRLVPLGIRVEIVARLFEVISPSAVLDHIEGIPVVSVPGRQSSLAYRIVKRGIDIVGAALALTALSPLFIFVAWKIKRDSVGPVFFRQTRYGAGMREFTSLKFRTMKIDTSPEQHREYIRAAMHGIISPEAQGLFKPAHEDAVTSVGRWLRRTSLDELPQLINVLRGEMSLVGPRPCIPYEIEHFAAHHFERFSVPGGLTGLWQVTARGHATFREALEMDVAYARCCSLGLDLRLILMTPARVLRSSGTQ
jgi:exopolysaccharide biosynthesis polyprenyl glycosylphosphotransferase